MVCGYGEGYLFLVLESGVGGFVGLVLGEELLEGFEGVVLVLAE